MVLSLPTATAGSEKGRAAGGSLRASAARSADEVPEFRVEGVGDEEQVREVRCAGAVFVSVDRLVVPADALAELDLGEVRVQACGADAFPDGPPARWHPVGQGVEWHPNKL
jgi:hypothetical protein